MDALKEQWRNIPEWQKVFLIGLVTVLILYGIYVLYIDPKQLEETRLKEEVKNLQIQLDRLKRFARPEIRKKLEDKLTSIKIEIKSLNNQLKKIRSVIPSEEKTQDILRYISDSAFRTNIVLNKFKISKPEKIYMRYNKSRDKLEIITNTKERKDKSFIKINRVKINLDMSGRTVADIVSFLRELARSDRFFRLDMLLIEKKKIKRGTNNFGIKLIISTYFM